jgi:hypothetical protein
MMNSAESNSGKEVQQLRRVIMFCRRESCRWEDERGSRQRVLDGKDLIMME